MDIDSLKPGYRIPEWQRVGTLDHWNRFAAANYEFAGHHMDDDVGRFEGFEGAFIMAPFSHAYLHAMLREWMDDAAAIASTLQEPERTDSSARSRNRAA